MTWVVEALFDSIEKKISEVSSDIVIFIRKFLSDLSVMYFLSLFQNLELWTPKKNNCEISSALFKNAVISSASEVKTDSLKPYIHDLERVSGMVSANSKYLYKSPLIAFLSYTFS